MANNEDESGSSGEQDKGPEVVTWSLFLALQWPRMKGLAGSGVVRGVSLPLSSPVNQLWRSCLLTQKGHVLFPNSVVLYLSQEEKVIPCPRENLGGTCYGVWFSSHDDGEDMRK